MDNNKEYIWVEKYRPKIVKDCILPSNIKKIAQKVVDTGNLQNMLFYSGPGMGKTTLARAMCEELDLDYIIINGSKEGRLIDTVRNTVSNFTNTMSVITDSVKPKVVIYDEFDNAGEVQMAIRGLIEEVSKTCRFIFTGNYITKIIDPIRSRVGNVDFNIPVSEKAYLMTKTMDMCESILKSEGVNYEKDALAGLIQKIFPDIRKIINELQLYAFTGCVDKGILDAVSTKVDELVEYVLKGKFRECRRWIKGNTFDGSIYSKIIDNIYEKIDSNEKKAAVIVLANDYQYKHNFAIDMDLNLAAFLLDLMGVLF